MQQKHMVAAADASTPWFLQSEATIAFCITTQSACLMCCALIMQNQEAKQDGQPVHL